MKKKRLPLAMLAARETHHYEAAEREHLGDWVNGTGIYHHSVIHPMGEQTLIYPREGFVYLYDIVGSTEVTDFNIYLSPMEVMP